MPRRRWWTLMSASAAAVVVTLAPLTPPGAQAYVPAGGVLYELGNTTPCTKGRGNCAIYAKSTALDSGRLVVAFELATVGPSGTAVGQTMPVYTSDDDGTSWQKRADVPAPAFSSSDPEVAKYTSNWTNPDLYVLPTDVGDLSAGTLLLATVVSGEDEYYVERKAADPTWVPDNDGDRRDMAIALYSSTDEGASWDFRNIITTGGWQGGSAGAIGRNVAAANVHRQIDPVWEPHLMVHDGQLVAYYSDEQDYTGFDPETGVLMLAEDNDTAVDPAHQILAHRTWDGTDAGWSEPVIDIPGLTRDRGDGVALIGGGRPGMTTVAPTTDGQYLLTYEYFGGGQNVRYTLSDDPLRFFDGAQDDEIGTLPRTPGSRLVSAGGSPVVTALPDGRILFNANGSANIWVNESGRSDGAWTERQTPIGAGYSRTMQYVPDTGRIVIFQSVWGGPEAGSTIRWAEVDMGDSVGDYSRITNRAHDQVMGTGGNTTDANIGNGDVPDVRLEAVGSDGSATDEDTQLWRVQPEADGSVTLLNKSGGREAAVWTGQVTAGQRIGQWVDDRAGGTWTVVPAADGFVRIRSLVDPDLYLTGSGPDAPLTVETERSDGSQEWRIDVVTTVDR